MGSLRGLILDPSGAVVPKAVVTINRGDSVFSTKSGGDGTYSLRGIPAGNYSLTVAAQGFVLPKTDVLIVAGRLTQLNLSLDIAPEQQNVEVPSENGGVSVSPDENAGAVILKDRDLDALSDDPDELQNELQALAGPAAGPNGGQIYIDGFAGGQIPPKSSILQIRVNRNPFSTEFDRLGYGRIEILTKPGAAKFSGFIMAFGLLSTLNTANPLVKEQPSYYGYSLPVNISEPLSKHGSYFLSFFHNDIHNQSIINAVNPSDVTTTVNEALPNPTSTWMIAPRFDFQLGGNNTVSIRDSFKHTSQTDSGTGILILPSQSYNVDSLENALQVSDTIVVNPRLINETHFQWRRIRNSQKANFLTPAVVVEGAFTDGGNSSGVLQDHQDILELQNYSTAIAGGHTIRFGARLRTYRDANYSTSGANGTYIFQSIAHYVNETPDQYQVTTVKEPLARALLVDAALFFQDDWRWKPNFTLSYGLRYEEQNRIHDHADWAPRVAVAWAPGPIGKTKPKTILRAGYGWYYNRFTVPNSFAAASGAPYVIQAIHQNGVNEQSYVVSNPDFYDPTATTPPESLGAANASIPSFYTIDRHFHAALDMQGAIGVDRQLGKESSLSVTYLITRGIHQYRTNNVTAQQFDPSTYTLIGAHPSAYNYQFQSGGVYNQQQMIVTANTRLHGISLHALYTLNEAKSDTGGVNYFPSVASNPHLDYGRAGFDIHHQMTVLGTYTAPHRITLSPMLIAQSGTPYNITIGNDLTGNNQFNARPTYGTCGAPNIVSTSYGCLDTDPVGKNEPIVPYGIGTGPANVVFNMRISKAIGIGPRVAVAHGTTAVGGNFNVGNDSLSSRQQRAKLDAEVPRRYTLTLIGSAYNLFNIVNLGVPNGVLSSSLFGTSQSLATGPFAPFSPGNRTMLLQASFNF